VLGKLAACDQNSNQTLREVLAVTGGDVSLVAPNSEPYIAHVLPLLSGARRKAGVAYSAVAAVFVHKAMLDLFHPLEALANYYKLTPTELRVLMAIVQVGGVLKAANVLGISQATVKTHLSRLFEKTSTNRQADLVRIVASFATPLITSSARLRQRLRNGSSGAPSRNPQRPVAEISRVTMVAAVALRNENPVKHEPPTPHLRPNPS
jgi:DNA-binding CsgD family transcriptional regulator